MIHTLEADSIVVNFGSRKVLSDIYIKCETGKVTGLLGRNGNGKSTLLNVLYGTLQPSAKSVRFNNAQVSCAFEVPGLIAYLTQFNFSPKSRKLKNVFEDFEVSYTEFEKHFTEFNNQYHTQIGSLSGGQQRLIETYVLLAGKAKFVLLDEPFTHLSPLMADQVKEMIKSALPQKGILLTDHMYKHVLDLSDDVYILSDGKLKLVKDPDKNFQLY